jgi:hypothetical protein
MVKSISAVRPAAASNSIYSRTLQKFESAGCGVITNLIWTQIDDALRSRIPFLDKTRCNDNDTTRHHAPYFW